MDVFIRKNGQNLGPFRIEELKQEVLAGRVTMSDLAWVSGWEHWKALKDSPEILPPTVPPPIPKIYSTIPPKIQPPAPGLRRGDQVESKSKARRPSRNKGIPWVFRLLPDKYLPDDYEETEKTQIFWRRVFGISALIGLMIFPVFGLLLTAQTYRYAYGTIHFWVLGWPSCCIWFIAMPGFIRLVLHAPPRIKLRSIGFFAGGLPAGAIVGLVVSLFVNFERMEPDPLTCGLFAMVAGAIAGYVGGTQPRAKKLSWG